MANTAIAKHKTVGTALTQSEFEAADSHDISIDSGAAGDILVGAVSGPDVVPTRLAIGTNTQILKSNGTTLAYNDNDTLENSSGTTIVTVSSDNMGVGTASPSSKLHLSDTGGASGGLLTESTGGATTYIGNKLLKGSESFWMAIDNNTGGAFNSSNEAGVLWRSGDFDITLVTNSVARITTNSTKTTVTGDLNVQADLDVDSDLNCDGDVIVDGNINSGGVQVGNVKNRFAGSFTSDGSSTYVTGLQFRPTLTAATGDTGYAAHVSVGAAGGITTQGATETVGIVSSAHILEPNITVGTGDTVTEACALYVGPAPTEGASNHSIYSAGAIRTATTIQSLSSILTPTTAPGSPVEGELYYDSAANKLKFYNGAAWETITSAV